MTRARRSSADAQKVGDLIDSVQQLRLTLAADLSAAAAALDEDSPDVARDIVAADCLEVRRLAHPAAPKPARPLRTRTLVAMTAIPLAGVLTASAAVALGAGPSQQPKPTTTASTAASQPVVARQSAHSVGGAATTLRQLARAVAERPRPAQVVALASHLHDQLTQIIAAAAHDPQRLGEVKRLLVAEQRLLERHGGAATALVLAESRHLTELLRSVTVPSPTPVVVLPTRHASPPASPQPSHSTSHTSAPQSPKSTTTTAPTGRHQQSGHHNTGDDPHEGLPPLFDDSGIGDGL